MCYLIFCSGYFSSNYFHNGGRIPIGRRTYIWDFPSQHPHLWYLERWVFLCYEMVHTVFIRLFEKTGRIMPWQCPSVRLSVCPSVFSGLFSTCFEISTWNLVYTFSGWHDISSLSYITIGSLWPSLQPWVGQTHFFLQSWPHKSR